QLPLDEAVRITRDVAGALAYAHERGIVHRDIKPENILLVGGSEPVVADFGVARALGAASGERLTRTGVGIGTPGYMSPEQVGGESNVDGRSDVYSLGCLLYEMIAGQPPFTGPTLESVVLQHLAAPIPRVTVIRPTVSPAVDRAIERALAKVPADRFATVNQFADALIGPAPAEPQRATASRIRRRSIVAGAALVLAVALIVLLQGQRQPTTDASVIAVLPFRVSGDSSVVFLREGMVDLLTTQLGSMEGQRPVDSRTVLAAWHRTVPTGNDPTTREARELAASMGSGRLILGEIVGTSAHLSISARILDVAGERQTEGAVQGPRDSLFTLVDRLTSQLVAGTAGEPGRRLADLTSTSLPALRAYLDGRAAFRRGELARARERYTNALELDSTFALAALGMASAGIWSQQAGQSAALRRGLLTGYALRDRLPLRDQLLFEAYVLPNTGAAHSAGEQLTAARRAAETAPDSPEAQYEYADRLYHSGVLLGIVDAQARAESAFARAVSLDSTFAPALAHLVEIAARSGDLRKTRRLAALYSAKASAADAGDYVRWRVALALGDNRTLA
ncbi:MAG: protein kinase domain-containing protein, partial [Gemmatimonadaceae bacterium]